jgi:RNA polymerase sigma-B factor
MTALAEPATGLTALDELSEYDDCDLIRVARAEPPGSRRRAEAREQLVTRYQALVQSCVRRYRGSPESADELTQVGYVGLMKAINRFDPEIGASLAPYALACITGEIKRHFRDKRWQVHVRRAAQDLLLAMRTASGDLAQQLRRAPTDSELASYLNVSAADLRDARQADMGLSAWSLDSPLSDTAESVSLAELIGEEDPGVEHALDMAALHAHWCELPERQQRILLLRFYGNMTQSQIAEQLGLSQMHVSRLISQSLSYLRERILGGEQLPS